jgi:hypothetical protein
MKKRTKSQDEYFDMLPEYDFSQMDDGEQGRNYGASRTEHVEGKFVSKTRLTERRTYLSKENARLVEYIAKRLIIEKAYRVLALDESPVVPVLDPSNFMFAIPVEVIPELLTLQKYFDLIFFRQTGAGFDVVCIKVQDSRSKRNSPSITQAKLVKVGRECLKYSNVVAYGQVTPVKFQLWEIFERNFTSDDAKRLRSLKRLPGRKSVIVMVQVIDRFSGKVVHSYAPGVLKLTGKGYLKRILHEYSTFSEKNLLEEFAKSGIEMIPILLGVTVGLIVGLLYHIILEQTGWTYYLAIDVFISFIPIFIAVYLPRIKTHSKQQGIISSALFAVLYYAMLWLLLGYGFTFWHPILIVIIVLWGNYMGSLVEP